MPDAPRRDVDAREGRLRAKAARAECRVGLRAAIPAIGAEKQDRRAREVEVVDRVAVRQVERGERLDDAVSAARDVVQVDDIDAERRTEAADELGPRLALLAREFEGAHAAVRPMCFDLPRGADGDREMVPVAVPRCIDQRSCVMLGAAAVAVDHVQDAMRRRRRERVGEHLQWTIVP